MNQFKTIDVENNEIGLHQNNREVCIIVTISSSVVFFRVTLYPVNIGTVTTSILNNEKNMTLKKGCRI